MSYFERHIAPVSLNPSSRAPLFDNSTKRLKSGRIGLEIECQPRHTSSNSAAFVLDAMMRVMSSISRQDLSVLLSGQYLPRPYAPSSDAANRVTSVLSAGFAGAASVNPSFNSIILRAMSGGSFR